MEIKKYVNISPEDDDFEDELYTFLQENKEAVKDVSYGFYVLYNDGEFWLKEQYDDSMEPLGRFYFEDGNAVFYSVFDKVANNWFSLDEEDE